MSGGGEDRGVRNSDGDGHIDAGFSIGNYHILVRHISNYAIRILCVLFVVLKIGRVSLKLRTRKAEERKGNGKWRRRKGKWRNGELENWRREKQMEEMRERESYGGEREGGEWRIYSGGDENLGEEGGVHNGENPDGPTTVIRPS